MWQKDTTVSSSGDHWESEVAILQGGNPGEEMKEENWGGLKDIEVNMQTTKVEKKREKKEILDQFPVMEIVMETETKGEIQVTETFEFSHFKPVNEFTEFGEFLLDTCWGNSYMWSKFCVMSKEIYYSGTSLSKLVFRIANVRPDNLTT